MQSPKAEVALHVMLALMAASLVLSLLPLSQHDVLPAPRLFLWVERHAVAVRATSDMLLATALLFGLAFVLPGVRRQARERGKLEMLTGVLRRRSREMEHAAQTDGLTNLRNRRFFDRALKRCLASPLPADRPLGLMIIDLDRFKSINDCHGHDVGDEVLRAAAHCLSELTRDGDILARLGGEEFAILAPRMRGVDLGPFADRIRCGIEAMSLDVGNVRLRITASIGFAVAGEDGDEPLEDAQGFYKRADLALYRAKTAGRNRVSA